MTSAAPDFASRRFQTAAAHYLAGRPPYPPQLIRRTAQLTGLGPQDRVLDLGCGPAQLAIAFAPVVGEVVAMDPEPEMLAHARKSAAAFANVRVAAGGSTDLGADLGAFRAVVIGRAFHWMDRPDTLRRLEGLVVPDGAVVLFGDDGARVPISDWTEAYREIIARYAEGDEARRRRRGDRFRSHVAVLLDSAFCQLEQVSVIWRWSFPAGILVERALSMSSTSRARLGERADEMIAELRAAIPAWSPDGTLTEVLSSSALIARRPVPAGTAEAPGS